MKVDSVIFRLRLSPGVGANSAKSNQVCRVRRKRKRVSASTPGEEERRSTKKVGRSVGVFARFFVNFKTSIRCFGV